MSPRRKQTSKLVGATLRSALAVHVPATLVAIAVATVRPNATFNTIAGGVTFGFAFWTLFEYALHRWFLHGRGWQTMHLDHHCHGQMNDPDHRALVLWLTVGSMIFTHAWVGAAFGATAFWVAAVAGYNLGYCAYEVLHWVHHATRWASSAAQHTWRKRKSDLHEHHHFHGLEANFGFITSFWDRVFGTYATPSELITERADYGVRSDSTYAAGNPAD